jgi:hypothetical protein
MKQPTIRLTDPSYQSHEPHIFVTNVAYIMFETINFHKASHSQQPAQTRYHSLKMGKPELTRKFVDLQFKEDHMTFGLRSSRREAAEARETEEPFYRTFHPQEKHKVQRKHGYVSHKTGRTSAVNNRESVIGTPFAYFDPNEQETPIPMLPSLDRERYKYLLNIVTSPAKLKRLP